MALDPRIALMGQGVDVGQAFTSALDNVSKMQQIKQRRAMMPIEEQLQQIALEDARSGQNEARKRQYIESVAQGGAEILPALESGDISGVLSTLQRRRADLAAKGLPTETTDEAIELAQTNPDLLKQRSMQAVQLGRQIGVFGGGVEATAAQRELDAKSKALVGALNPSTNKPFTEEEAKQEIILRESGIVPRAGMSAQERIAADQDITSRVARSQASIEGAKSGAKEVAKLSAQLRLSPEVKAASSLAVDRATAVAKSEETSRSNEKAMQVYEAGISGLSEALGKTETGVFVGNLPALTSDQQAADGAVAAMAPILKQMFRSAGEGNFTDSDQKILLDMIPTRKDKPAARAAKLKNIDTIVRAKLGGSPQPSGVQSSAKPDPLGLR